MKYCVSFLIIFIGRTSLSKEFVMHVNSSEFNSLFNELEVENLDVSRLRKKMSAAIKNPKLRTVKVFKNTCAHKKISKNFISSINFPVDMVIEINGEKVKGRNFYFRPISNCTKLYPVRMFTTL